MKQRYIRTYMATCGIEVQAETEEEAANEFDNLDPLEIFYEMYLNGYTIVSSSMEEKNNGELSD